MAQPRNSSASILYTFLFFFFFFVCVCLSGQTNGEEHTWQEAFEALGIAWNPDGTLNRTIQIPMVGPTEVPPPIALSADVYGKPYRLYRPLTVPKYDKLPLIIYTHGGDFVLFSLSTVIFHNFCNDIAAQFPAIVVSVEYRLAPENRLPAAYYDAIDAIFWVKEQALGTSGRDPWLEYADFSRVFLMGSSAGGNIAFHAAISVAVLDTKPVKIQGLLLNQPYFGGEKRTESEIRLKDDPFVALYVNDVLWTLALPSGANRDHEYCNPISGGDYFGRMYKLPRVYIKGDYGDPLVDRSTLLVNHLRSHGVDVVYQYSSGGGHGIEQRNDTAAQELYKGMFDFINSTAKAQTAASYASI